METSNQTEYNYNWDELSVGNYKQNDSGRFFGKNFSILCFNNQIKKKKKTNFLRNIYSIGFI